MPTKRVPRLTEQELLEFRLRAQTVEQARHAYLLIDEGHRGWLRDIGRKYRVGTRFDVQLQDGTLIPRPNERSNGTAEHA